MGNFTAVGDLGRVGISALITLIASYVGWRLTSGLYGAIGLGVFALLWQLSKERRSENTSKPSSVSFSFLIKHPKFIAVSLTGMLDAFASSSLFIFIPFLLLEKGVGTAALGLLTAFFLLAIWLAKPCWVDLSTSSVV